MRAKKSKAKGKTIAKAPVKQTVKRASRASSGKRKKPVDIVKVREKISDLIGDAAKDIANEVIKVAKTGQLASAKYLFEAVGLYPPTEETKPKAKEGTLAHVLLNRMGLPIKPVNCDEEKPVLSMKDEGEASSGANESADEDGDGQREAVAVEGGE